MTRKSPRKSFASKAASTTVAAQMMLSTCMLSAAFAGEELQPGMMRNASLPVPRISETEVKDLLTPAAAPSTVTPVSTDTNATDTQKAEEQTSTQAPADETKQGKFSRLKRLVKGNSTNRDTKENSTTANGKTAEQAAPAKEVEAQATTAAATDEQTKASTTPDSQAKGWESPSGDASPVLKSSPETPSTTTAAATSPETPSTTTAATAASTEPPTTAAQAPVGDTVETKGQSASATEPQSESAATDKKADAASNSDDAKLALVPTAAASTNTDLSVDQDGPVVVDNDEAVETAETIAYEDLPTDEGKTRVKTGARFPVVVCSDLSSKSAKKGDPVEARLKYDLKIGDRLVAKKGDTVTGHINYVLKARSAMHSLVSPERWYRNSGVLGITFDEIVTEKGEHLPLVAAPSRQALIVKNKGEGRVLGVNHQGQVTGPWSQQLKYKAVRIGLNAAMAPAGVFSFGAMPVALGVIGAANPSFAFMKPVGQNVRHRRIKGFVWGALSGVPGSWIIEDTVVKGQESVIKPGDEFLCEFQQEFTGEPASEAQMMPGSSAKVHGQVMPGKEKKKK